MPDDMRPAQPESPALPDRRRLLAALGAGGAALALGGIPGTAYADSAVPAQQTPTAPAVGGNNSSWRSMFVLDHDPLFMNVGTVGSPPRVVLDAMADEEMLVARTALSEYHSTLSDERTAIASGLGCDPDELFMSGNTTDGIGTVLNGLALNAGDEVLTTNHEHPAVNTPLAILHNRRGVVVKQVALPVGNRQRAEDYVALFEQTITPRTRVLLFSAPVFRTGTMLPIRALAELAQRHGLISVVDGAHIPGMFAYNFRELGVDFLAASGGKWQCGPARSGLLYLRNKVLPAYNPNPLPEFWPTISSSQGYPAAGLPPRTTNATASYDIAAILQDTGNPSLTQIKGLVTACGLWDQLGRGAIQDYVLGLSARMKAGLAERWGMDALYSPVDDPRLHSALSTFNPFANPADVMDLNKANAFVTRLHDEYKITIRTTIVPVVGAPAAHNVIRVSTHLFHTTDDVDRFVDSAWRLSREMA